MVYIRVPPNSEDISQTTSIGGSRRMSKTTIFKDVQNEGKKGQNIQSVKFRHQYFVFMEKCQYRF